MGTVDRTSFLLKHGNDLLIVQIYVDDIVFRGSSLLTVKILQPSHEFTFGVGISFIPYPLVLTPVV
jgi:hypothetical protein